MLSPLYALKVKTPFDDLWTGPWSTMGYSECSSHPPTLWKSASSWQLLAKPCLESLQKWCVLQFTVSFAYPRGSLIEYRNILLFSLELFLLFRKEYLSHSHWQTRSHFPFPLLPHLNGKLMAQLLRCLRYLCSEFL